MIRPTKFLDIPDIIKVNLECLPENYSRSFWEEQFYLGKDHSFVAVCGDIVAYVFCNKDSIISFAVQEKFRKKGIGKQLLHHCLNTFQIPIYLNVRVHNENAIGLYSSLGFTILETISNYYHSPKEDGYKMSKLPFDKKYEEKKKMNILVK